MANLKNPHNDRVIGILGGMGPYATVMFMKNILDGTDAPKDWDHIRTVVDNNTHIPSRSRALLYDEESPLEGMLDSARRLQAYPVDIIAIPCNSACFWAHDLQRKVKVPVINIVDVAVRDLHQMARGGKRVVALGGMVPYLKELYRGPLEKAGFTYVSPEESIQERIVAAIENVKSRGIGKPFEADFLSIVHDLVEKQQVEAIVLACTEFSEFRFLPFPVPFVDSNESLAKMIVEYAYHKRSIFLDTDEIKRFWERQAAKLREHKVGIHQATMLTLDEEKAIERDKGEKEALLTPLAPYLSREGTMFEMGCGIGRWSRELSKHVKSLVSFDYNETFIDIAKEETARQGITNVEYFVADVGELKAEKTYDFVTSIALLHYLSDEQYDSAVSLMRDSVKPGGVAIFREVFGVTKRFELHGFYSEVLDAEYHAIYRTDEELVEKMGPDFERIFEHISLPATESKPETHQVVLILRRKA
ncbi:amino acid racemase [Myxococcota bacterium]|nr:amino acid racemase [Myxococcota bacterium]MBU1537715.1 amino acid racemase [Myxococcota bacterium]